MINGRQLTAFFRPFGFAQHIGRPGAKSGDRNFLLAETTDPEHQFVHWNRRLFLSPPLRLFLVGRRRRYNANNQGNQIGIVVIRYVVDSEIKEMQYLENKILQDPIQVQDSFSNATLRFETK